jgi:hypothetical protein
MTEELDASRLPLIEQLLLGELGMSIRTGQNLIDRYGELKVQTVALQCLWILRQGTKIRTPAAWMTSALENEWAAPPDMPPEWQPTVLTFRVDDDTFLRFIREMREDTGTS